MQRKKQVRAIVTLIMILIGETIGHLHLLGPNPGTYFTLGVFATLSVLGIAYGFWDARRVVRSGKPIGN